MPTDIPAATATICNALIARGVDAYRPGDETVIVDVNPSRAVMVNVYADGDVSVDVVNYEDGEPVDDETLIMDGSVMADDVDTICALVIGAL